MLGGLAWKIKHIEKNKMIKRKSLADPVRSADCKLHVVVAPCYGRYLGCTVLHLLDVLDVPGIMMMKDDRGCSSPELHGEARSTEVCGGRAGKGVVALGRGTWRPAIPAFLAGRIPCRLVWHRQAQWLVLYRTV